MDKTDLEHILEAESVLNTIGFGLSNGTRYKSLADRTTAMVQRRAELLEQIDICDRVATWLKANTKRRATINRENSSYTWKHIVEKEIGTYVSNGAFIAAAIYCGYQCKPIGGENPNAFFNISRAI